MLRSAPKVLNPIHVALAVLLTTVTPCFAQGQVYFANRVGLNGSIVNPPATIYGAQTGLVQITASALFFLERMVRYPAYTRLDIQPLWSGRRGNFEPVLGSEDCGHSGHFAGETLNFVVQAWLTSEGSYALRRLMVVVSVCPISPSRIASIAGCILASIICLIVSVVLISPHHCHRPASVLTFLSSQAALAAPEET